ncbi:prolyl oligopeptidase family serine peptidase [Larkinella sp. C7]|uniref:carboxylesterase family protein n=1 Tax=Larkinella sp. C7 TaxID=2576607 RepID=UPI001485D454|nr:prolyl oligopeptidase family serine peptidase [Larkinella sp. C7]
MAPTITSNPENAVKSLSRTVFLLGLWLQLPTCAQTAWHHKEYQQSYFQGLRYGLFTPRNYQRGKVYPLIVYLHGSRDTVSRDNIWYQASIQNEHPCFVLTPKCEEPEQGWGNTWTDTHTAAMRKTLALVDSLVKHYGIDKSRLYLYGISMGGFGVFSVLAKEPGKFAAAYAVCGGSNESVASRIKTPLWIFHGADDDVVPVRLSRDIYREMVRQGKKTVRYTEYPGVKHNSWENVAQEKSLPTWLFLQQKSKTGPEPDPAENPSQRPQDNGVRVSWTNPTQRADRTVWYYKLFRDKTLLTELPGDATDFVDTSVKSRTFHQYSLTAVSYFFIESKPSIAVLRK